MLLVFGCVNAVVSVFDCVLVSCVNNSRIYGEVLAGKNVFKPHSGLGC